MAIRRTISMRAERRGLSARPRIRWTRHASSAAITCSKCSLITATCRTRCPCTTPRPPTPRGGIAATTTCRPSPPRPDPFSTFRAGFEIRTLRLCRRVLMLHHFKEGELTRRAPGEIHPLHLHPGPARRVLGAHSRSPSGDTARIRTMPPAICPAICRRSPSAIRSSSRSNSAISR